MCEDKQMSKIITIIIIIIVIIIIACHLHHYHRHNYCYRKVKSCNNVSLLFYYLHTRHFNFYVSVLNISYREGLCVVKVFAIQDPSLPLKTYQYQLTEIKNRLAGASNVLPFYFSILTDKASLLIRQFFKDNLYDRICLLYTSPSPRDQRGSRMPSSA